MTTTAPPPTPPQNHTKYADLASKSTAGRKRRASATTRIFGHFLAEKTPRATWCVGVLILERDPGGNILRDTLWSRLGSMGRFRSRLNVGRFGGYWEELPETELLRLRDSGYLWSEVLTDGKGTIDDLNAVVGATDEWNYDRHAPLWRAQYARKLADGRAGLIVCINHGIGDGVSLIATLLGICDQPDEEKDGTGKSMAQSRGSMAAPGKRLKGPALGKMTKFNAFWYGVYHGLTSSKWAPDPKNALSIPDVTKPSKSKRVKQAERIPLEEMKKLKNKFPGASLNDIMMAVMTATIRAYLLEKQDKAADGSKKVRGAFPINLRSPKEPVLRDGDPMNKWAYGIFNFDFKYKTRIELVWKVKNQIDKIKVSPSPLIQYKLAGVLTKTLPRRVLLDQLLNMANLSTAQLSNVPGPSQIVNIAGIEVKDMYFYLFSPVGLYIGLLSYAGQVSCGINVDGTTTTDVDRLAELWKSEFDALKAECDAYPDTVPVPKKKWL
jgi:hypothetical protein